MVPRSEKYGRGRRQRGVLNSSDAAFDVIDDLLTIECEAQGPSHDGIGNDRVRDVEIKMIVRVTRLLVHLDTRDQSNAVEIRTAELIPHVDFVVGHFCE